MRPRRIAIALLMCLILGPTVHAAEDEANGETRPVLSAKAALARLSAGRLHNVSVQGLVDLAELDAQPASANQPAGPYFIEEVIFRGPVRGAAPGDLHIQDTDFADLAVPRTVWRHALRFERVRFNGLVDFRYARFEGPWECVHCAFSDDVMFTDAVFSASFRLIAASLQADTSANFSGARFSRETSFEETQFPNRTLFQNALFEADASFVKTSGPLMIFIGAQLRGDAEFRSCDFVEARFGLPRDGAGNTDDARPVDLVTAFEGFTDFRRCKIGKAVFNDVFMSGPVNFGGAAIGADGLWLVGATGGDNPFDLRSASFAGPINLEEAILPGLLVQWNDVRQGLAQAGTNARIYHQLARFFRDNGKSLDALRAEYEAKRLEWKTWPGKSQDTVAAFAEWWLWTWPTRNGTSILRVLGIAAAIWLIVGASLLPIRRRLVFLPSNETGSKNQAPSSKPWNPLNTAQLPASANLRGGAISGALRAFFFAFVLLFKLSPWKIRYVGTSYDGSPSSLSIYLFFIWLLGFGLVGIAALTIANLSPPLRTFMPGI